MTTIIKRIFELVFGCVFFSAIYTIFLFNTNLTENSTAIKILGILLVILYTFFNWNCVRKYYYIVDDDFLYGIYNIFAIIVFLGVAFAVWFFSVNNVFLWMFSLTSIFSFLFDYISNLKSLIYFGGIIFITTFISQYVMSR